MDTWKSNQAFLDQMQSLREETHRQIEEEERVRIKYNPHPTEEELQLGAFKEMLELQVRDAIFTMVRKGYIPESSGFGGDHGEIQMIDGYFHVDDDTKKNLQDIGIMVTEDEGWGPQYTHVRFRSDTIDILSIKDKWDTFAALLPAQEINGEVSISGGSSEFRKQFALARLDVEQKERERALRMLDLHPELKALYKERLEELQQSELPSSRVEFEKRIDELSERLWGKAEHPMK